MPFEQRRSHIKRIYMDNDNTNDVWVDIERVDNFTTDSVHPDNLGGQSSDYSFDWDSFDPNDENNDVLTIENPADSMDASGNQLPPGQSSSDEVTRIKIPLRNFIAVQNSGRLVYVYFDNTENNQVRKVHTNRIYNRDIPEESLDADRQPPRDAEEYFNTIQNMEPDKSQYIEVEVIDKYVLDKDRSYTYKQQNWSQNINAILSEGL